MELISKEEVIEAIRAIKEVMLTNAEVIKTIDMQDVIKIDEGYIEELEKKVNESRPKGKWQKSKYDWYTCSCCKWIRFVKSDYCPECGALMEVEE